ncbi:1-(5-phosphoribosyl)-5-[(5-phosphoribosylamino)methylideneamino]imidazole-4-carboxamide isomerase [bacterium]|nr:1-(5-phosphoribosyl)-5-[(5-phosphoribosylamino)methylideneamino]imidazole-4-carboxamide isomerase [bacterium]
MFEVIPAIDLLGGKVVRLTQGDYSQVENYPFSPAEIAQRFQAAGATRIHVVDLDGAKDGFLVNGDVIHDIRQAVDCTIELGGGIRSLETASQLLAMGVNYIILGSLLVKQFELAHDIIHRFPGRVIAGLDAKNGQVATEGWLDLAHITAVDLIARLNEYPLGGIIYTDISKDGTLAGPNLDQLRDVASVARLPVIASGGVGSRDHIDAVRGLSSLGIHGVIVGKAVLGGHISLTDLFR